MRRGDGGVRIPGIADTSKCPLRIPPRELAVVDLRLQVDPVAGILRDLQAVVNRIGRAGWNQPDVRDGSCAPGVPLVDGIAMFVQKQAAVLVCTGLDRALAAVGRFAAVEDRPAVIVDGLELDPDVESIDGAARK